VTTLAGPLLHLLAAAAVATAERQTAKLETEVLMRRGALASRRRRLAPKTSGSQPREREKATALMSQRPQRALRHHYSLASARRGARHETLLPIAPDTQEEEEEGGGRKRLLRDKWYKMKKS
jgi:hypothetical protein